MTEQDERWVKCEGIDQCKFFACPHSVWHERNADCDKCDFNWANTHDVQHCKSHEVLP